MPPEFSGDIGTAPLKSYEKWDAKSNVELSRVNSANDKGALTLTGVPDHDEVLPLVTLDLLGNIPECIVNLLSVLENSIAQETVRAVQRFIGRLRRRSLRIRNGCG